MKITKYDFPIRDYYKIDSVKDFRKGGQGIIVVLRDNVKWADGSTGSKLFTYAHQMYFAVKTANTRENRQPNQDWRKK